MVKFSVNDIELEIEEGKTILEAVLDYRFHFEGIEIPTLCYHKELAPYGACRMCLVEIVDGGKPGLEAACVYKVTDGLKIKTDTERVKRARKIVLELLLARCPDSEKIRKLAAKYGVTETRIKLKKKENCILCGLCVRVCAEISQRNAQSFSGRGKERKVETPFNKISKKCIGCGACAYLCPVNAITIEEAD